MGPFNYPLNETFTTLIPALIMGNTVIFKPPKLGVLLYGPLMKAFADSFPRGVINTVFGTGSGVVGPLIKSGRIDVLAFIGSAKAAAALKHDHPHPNRLRVRAWPGGEKPRLRLARCRPQPGGARVALGAVVQRPALHRHQGHLCPTRFDGPFCQKFAEEVSKLKVGMPWEDGVSITPLPEDGKPNWLKGLVDEAVAGGSQVVNQGGGTIDHTLYYPAVVSPAQTKAKICQVEQFGPVTPIVPYDNEQEALDWLIASYHGQQAALFGRDPQCLSRLIDPLINQVCRVNVNSQCQRGPDKFPFGGRKETRPRERCRCRTPCGAGSPFAAWSPSRPPKRISRFFRESWRNGTRSSYRPILSCEARSST